MSTGPASSRPGTHESVCGGKGNSMAIISYAQNHEDVLLQRLFRESPSGFYIDVGACHPVVHSVTKLFYERGWNGINIEPIPSLSEMLARERPRDINLRIGLSNRQGTSTLYECPTGVGTLDLLRRAGSRPATAGLRTRRVFDARHDPGRDSASSMPIGRSIFSRSMSRDSSRKCSREQIGADSDRGSSWWRRLGRPRTLRATIIGSRFCSRPIIFSPSSTD